MSSPAAGAPPRTAAAARRAPAAGGPGGCPEFVEMLWAVATGSQMGPGEGWFHPGQSRYGWRWLARQQGVGPDGRITRQAFRGPPPLFDALDRNHDGVLTAEDFDWSDRSPFVRQTYQAAQWFGRIDADSNGRISRAEWEAFFKKAAGGKKYLTPDDLRQALLAAPPRPAGRGPQGPSAAMLFRGLLAGELGSFAEGPAIDGRAPDFTLPTHDGKGAVRLSKFRGKKPVVLVFGSFT